MKHYVFYGPTGEARSACGLTDDIDPASVSPLPWIVVPNPVSPLEGYVRDGEWVAYTEQGKERRSRRPAYSAQWDVQTQTWVDLRGLEELRSARWEAIKAAREAAKVAPTMETPYGVVDADAKAIENLKGTLMGLQAAQSLGQTIGLITWTMADNSEQQFTLAQLSEIAMLVLGRGNAAHEKGRLLRAQIDAAQTPEAVEAVVW